MDGFVTVFRILGNDLPPRHNAGQTINNLKFILEHEGCYDECIKRWIINRIVDNKTENNIINLLEYYKQKYIRLPFHYDEYINFIDDFVNQCLEVNNEADYRQVARYAKSLYIMNVNRARNISVKAGIELGDWVMPLDSNCFFTTQGWNSVKVKLEKEKDLSKVFFIPMYRLTRNDQTFSFNPEEFAEHEPQLVFGKYTNVEFDEFHRYGDRSKTELFDRLGYKTRTDELGMTIEGDTMRCGFVLRLFSGIEKGERSSIQRYLLREEGIDNIIEKVDSQTSPKVTLRERIVESQLPPSATKTKVEWFDLVNTEKDRIISLADRYINAEPLTVTAHINTRSAGGIHDYSSEGDYWWPGPFNQLHIREHEPTNPDNFIEHRKLIIRLRVITGSLASAYLITNDDKYVISLATHLNAWFVDKRTRMSPHLLYSQAIPGSVPGQGFGIVDTIHLVEVALAIITIQKSSALSKDDLSHFVAWFSEYLAWIVHHPYGKLVQRYSSNHIICWVMQAAAFATLTKNDRVLQICLEVYKDQLIPNQMNAKAESISHALFTQNAIAAVCQILSFYEQDLFLFQTTQGEDIRRGVKSIQSYVEDTEKRQYQQNVPHWTYFPVRQCALLFTGLALSNIKLLDLWKSLRLNMDELEAQQATFIDYPLLWVYLHQATS